MKVSCISFAWWFFLSNQDNIFCLQFDQIEFIRSNPKSKVCQIKFLVTKRGSLTNILMWPSAGSLFFKNFPLQLCFWPDRNCTLYISLLLDCSVMMMMMMGKVVVVGKRVLRRERDWPTASFVLDPHNSTENKNFQSLISITENGGCCGGALNAEKVECNRCCKSFWPSLSFFPAVSCKSNCRWVRI
jgi:hypothetical protein